MSVQCLAGCSNPSPWPAPVHAHPKNLTPEEKQPVCETQNLPQSPAAVWRTIDMANSKYLGLNCDDCRCRWVCGSSFARISVSNRASDMDACLLWVLCVVRGLFVGLFIRPEDSYRVVWVSSWNLVVGAQTQQGLSCHKEKQYFSAQLFPRQFFSPPPPHFMRAFLQHFIR
jgi:hypothetical protein